MFVIVRDENQTRGIARALIGPFETYEDAILHLSEALMWAGYVERLRDGRTAADLAAAISAIDLTVGALPLVDSWAVVNFTRGRVLAFTNDRDTAQAILAVKRRKLVRDSTGVTRTGAGGAGGTGAEWAARQGYTLSNVLLTADNAAAWLAVAARDAVNAVWLAIGRLVTEASPWACVACGDDCDVDSRRDDYCDDCGATCERCDRVVNMDEMNTVTTSPARYQRPASQALWCDDCVGSRAFECSHCSNLFHDDLGCSCEGCGEICSSCAEETYWCDDCDARFCSDDHGSQCENHDDTRDSRGVLFGYSYTPYNLTFNGTGPTYLGLELEASVAVSVASEIHENHGGLIYCKSDSSVEGFELVTHPMTYEWAVENFPWDVLRTMAANGRAGENGVHVHVSKAAFDGQDHIAAWMTLIYAHRSQVEAIARRSGSTWARWDAIQSHATLVDKIVYGESNRYSAINDTNEKTFEMRVFASSLDKREVLAALGLVDASVEYCRTPAAQAGDVDWDSFQSWVWNQGAKYESLLSEAYERITVAQ